MYSLQSSKRKIGEVLFEPGFSNNERCLCVLFGQSRPSPSFPSQGCSTFSTVLQHQPFLMSPRELTSLPVCVEGDYTCLSKPVEGATKHWFKQKAVNRGLNRIFPESQTNHFSVCNLLCMSQEVKVEGLHSVHPSSAEAKIMEICLNLKKKNNSGTAGRLSVHYLVTVEMICLLSHCRLTMSIRLVSPFHSLVRKSRREIFCPVGRRAGQRRAGQRPGLESLVVAAAGEMSDRPKTNK